MTKVIIGMEAISIHNFHPAYLLANNYDLQKLSLETDVVNPKKTNNFMTFTNKIKIIPLLPITSRNT